MGRRFPANDIDSLHPVLSFSFLAVIAISAGLCGARSRRRSRKSSPVSTDSSVTDYTEESRSNAVVAAVQEQELRLPMSRNYSHQRKISRSLSMKVITRSLSMARQSSDRDRNQTAKMDGVDGSVWMKTIILGEKCKVPDHGDRDRGGVIFEGNNGVKITAYHPRSASSFSLSRQCSFSDPQAN